MTIESTRVEPPTVTIPATEVAEVREGAVHLLAELARRPVTFRIRASDVVVEVDWTGQPGGSPPEEGWTPPAVPAPTPPPPDAAPPPAETEGLLGICAPTVGTFYRSPQPGASPFVAVGDQVRRGQQVGIVEAMKLMIPLEAEHAGQVVEVLADDGAPVEYGERLFSLAPIAG